MATALVHGPDSTGSILAVRLIRERLLDFSVLVAVKTSVLYKLEVQIKNTILNQTAHTIDIG